MEVAIQEGKEAVLAPQQQQAVLCWKQGKRGWSWHEGIGLSITWVSGLEALNVSCRSKHGHSHLGTASTQLWHQEPVSCSIPLNFSFP